MPDLSSTLLYVLQRKNALRDQARAQADAAANMLVQGASALNQQRGAQAQEMGAAAHAAGKATPVFDDARLSELAGLGATQALGARQAATQQAERQRALEMLRQKGDMDQLQLREEGENARAGTQLDAQRELAGQRSSDAFEQQSLQDANALERLLLTLGGRKEVAGIQASRPRGGGGYRPDYDPNNPAGRVEMLRKAATQLKGVLDSKLKQIQLETRNPMLTLDQVRDDPRLSADFAAFQDVARQMEEIARTGRLPPAIQIVPPAGPATPAAEAVAGNELDDFKAFQESRRAK